MSELDLRMYLHRPNSIYNFFDETCPASTPEANSGIAGLVKVKRTSKALTGIIIEHLNEDSSNGYGMGRA